MTQHYTDGRMVMEPSFANDPAFNQEWESLQKTMGTVLKEAHSTAIPDQVTGVHPFFGACRNAIRSIERLMQSKHQPPVVALMCIPKPVG